jgi:hypothetical protein
MNERQNLPGSKFAFILAVRQKDSTDLNEKCQL